MIKPDKRDEIARAALELIAEKGFHASPMAELAKRAGVGAGTIYRYFENKDVLITVLFSELEARVQPVLLKGYDASQPVRHRFLHLGQALLGYFIANPLDFRYLEQFINSPYGAEHRRAKIFGEQHKEDVYRELFDYGIDSGEIKNLPLAVLFSLTFGPLIFAARDHICGFIELNEKLVFRTIDACWQAVKS